VNASLLAPARMTVEEFLAWAETQPGDDRWELVDGKVVAMAATALRGSSIRPPGRLPMALSVRNRSGSAVMSYPSRARA